MTGYQLLRRSITWTIPRYIKVALATVIGLLIGYLIVREKLRYAKLEKIYRLQSAISDILDLEIQYMARQVYPEEDDWTGANNTEGHIYSAYLDTRPEIIMRYSSSRGTTWGQIVIIAVLPTSTKSSVSCVLRYEATDRTTTTRLVPARVRAMNDNWDLRYSASFILCDLVHATHNFEVFYNVKQLPESVGISWSHSASLDVQFVDVHYPKFGVDQSYGPVNFMAVCVPVLHHKFNRALELIEFVEYYRMMGVEHFTFYNSSISTEVDRVLEFYRLNLIATVLNWNLPSIYVYEKTLRQQGLFGALNDCLYRNTNYNSYKYIGVFAVDEFLVPRYHNNFSHLIRELDPNGADDVASFLFRNVYFYTMYGDDGEINAQPYLYTRAKTRRLSKPHKARERSRYIVRGGDTFEIGNYNVWEFREGSRVLKKSGFKECTVEPEVALLHHYAPCEAEETGCYLKATVIDESARRFSKELGKSVGTICFRIFGRKGCPPPAKRSPG